MSYCVFILFVCVLCLQLQLTQKTSAPPQEPVSIIVPIIYDMASGTTQQADIPRQQNSSVAAPMMVSNILKRFAEMNPPRQGTWPVDDLLLRMCCKFFWEISPSPRCFLLSRLSPVSSGRCGLSVSACRFLLFSPVLCFCPCLCCLDFIFVSDLLLGLTQLLMPEACIYGTHGHNALG